jgi:hypothetical protein
VINAKISAADQAEARRRETRLEIEAEVPLRELGRESVDAKLINLSSHGFMAETEALIEPGSRVWLKLPGVARANALVVWTGSGRVGGEFATPIDPLKVFQALGKKAGT